MYKFTQPRFCMKLLPVLNGDWKRQYTAQGSCPIDMGYWQTITFGPAWRCFASRGPKTWGFAPISYGVHPGEFHFPTIYKSQMVNLVDNLCTNIVGVI